MGSIVIEDRALALAVADRGAVGCTREIDEEGFVVFDRGVAPDDYRYGFGGDAGCETERPGDPGVIAARGGRSVGGSVVDAEGRRAAGTRYCKRHQVGAAVAFRHRHVIDRNRAGTIVVDDRALALG